MLHLKSRDSMIELKEHEIVTDFMQEAEVNGYFLTHVVNRPLEIDIQVLDGELEAKLTNNRNISLVETSSKEKKLIHLGIESQESHLNSQILNFNKFESLMGGYEFSQTFGNYQLTLKNVPGSNTSCIYTIVYSSG